MTVLAYRDQVKARGVVPWFLRGWVGGRLMYAFGLHFDLVLEVLVRGVKARFPSFNQWTTPILCRDRGMTRGPEETEAQICERLRMWRQTARVKGCAVALLKQLQAYLTPHVPRIRLVTNVGRYTEISSTGQITVGDMTWNWDGNTTLWTRFWLLIWVPTGLWSDDGTFDDDGLVEDAGTFGSSALPAAVAGVLSLVRTWSRVAARLSHVILIWNDTDWQAQQPDGTWGTMSQRNPSAEYWPEVVV